MKVCIYIPIKTNNTRLPGKTFKLLAGKPLYSYLFNTIKKLGIPVYISSSDDSIQKISKEWGFNFLKQPEELNANTITGNALLNHYIDLIDADQICFCHITSPFMSLETIKKGISELEGNRELDSILGVSPIYNRCWFNGKPINHDPEKLLRTQDLTPIYVETPDIYFVKKESFKKYKKRVCGNLKTLVVQPIEATDIDNLSDFINAESLLNSGIVNFKWD